MVLLIVINQLLEHAVQHCRYCEETFHCCADVAQSFFIAQNLLDYEGSHCF